MSYCRFQNTVRDLRDCESTLEALFNVGETPLSNDELDAAVELVEACKRILSACEDQLASRQLVEDRTPRESVLETSEGVIVALLGQANEQCKLAAEDDNGE